MSRVFSLAKPLSLATLGVLVGIFAASAATPQPQVAAPVSPVTHTYGAFWQVGNGYSSTLVLKNNDPRNAVSARATLFGSTGQAAGVAPVQIAANGVNRIDLSTLAGPHGGSGGLMLQFTGPVAQFAGKVVITNTQSGASAELPLHGGYRYDTENALYAPWWLPDGGTEGRITLFNASAQSLIVSPSIVLRGAEQAGNKVRLAPYATTQLSLSDLLGASHEVSGAVVLRYSGSPHGLHPALLLENKSTGFWLASNFNAKHAQLANQPTTWQFPDVRFGNASPNVQDGVLVETYALLTNGTASRLSPQLTVYYGVRGKATKAELPVPSLAPLETRLIDLSQVVSAGLIPPSASEVGLSAAHSGLPGDLAVNIFSVGKTNNLVFKALGTVLPTAVVDASYWNTATNVCLLPRVQNDSSTTATGQVAVYYPTAFGVDSYILPALSVAGGKSRGLALKQDLQAGIPDQSGTVVPGGTSSGMLTLAAVNGIGSSPSGSAAAVDAECKTAETCAAAATASSGAPSSAGSGLHLIAPPTCGAPPPVITSVSPTGAPFDTDNTVYIYGDNLDDPAITVSVTGGISASIQSATSTEIVATLDTGGETTVGTQDLFLISDYGHSNSQDFQVGDRTPSITNISPLSWPAGTITPVTITGSGFGTNPKVTLSDPNILWSLTSATDNGTTGGATINGTVNVPPCTLAEAVNVDVTSQGYNGSGFLASTPGQSPEGPAYGVSVTPLAAPAATISMNGTVISGSTTTTTAVVGQQIVLTTSGQPCSVTSNTWVVPGDTNGGFNPQTLGNQVQPTNFTQSSNTFYWTNAGNSRSVTYSYAMSNGQSSPVATAKFNVSGASGSFTATPGTVDVWASNIAFGGKFQYPGLELGNATSSNGIDFAITATAPTGGGANAAFQWVQLINSSTVQKYRTTPSTPNVVPGAGLDNWYPYVSDSGNSPATNDSPGMQLTTTGTTAFGEAAETFGATMYLMWDPALPSGCTPASTLLSGGAIVSKASTCKSIPVPIAHVSWGFNGDAINTLENQANQTTWILSCGAPTPASPVTSDSYPTWTKVDSNTNQ